MRVFAACAAALLLAALALPAPAPAQVAPVPAARAASDADLRRSIASAYRLLEAGEAGKAMQVLPSLRDALEDDGDPELLLAVQEMIGLAGAELHDRAAEIGGHVHSVILNHMLKPFGAVDTLLAELTLVETYRRHGVRDAQLYLLANVQAGVSAERRAGRLTAETEEVQAMAEALMAERLRADDRPELALVFYRRARELALRGRLDPSNASKIDNVIAEIEQELKARAPAPPPAPDGCIGSAALAQAEMAACRAAADTAIARGDAAAAERILSGLLADVPRGSLRAERYDAARDLLLLRMLTREASDPELTASTTLVADYLASIGEVTAAALIGARAARAAIDRGSHDVAIASMCGHIARRAARNGAEAMARRMLTLQWAVVMAGLPAPDGTLSAEGPAAGISATDGPLAGRPASDSLAASDAFQRQLVAGLLRLEGAQIAAGAGHARRAAAERAAAQPLVAAIDLADFDRVESLTAGVYAEARDYVYPTFTAAVELLGLLSRRLPVSDPRRDATLLRWVGVVDTFWADTARAASIADDGIRDIRAAPQGREPALATLLTMRAAMAEAASPELSARYTREAYGIVTGLPGRESQRIELLLDMVIDQTDKGLAQALVREAQKLREATPGISVTVQARLDLKRAYMAFDDDDRALALRLGEGAIAGLVAAGKAESWVIVEPARNLAALYAALGRMEDARKTYETYVFPRSDPVIDGEERAIADRLGLANLQAYYGPDEATLRSLATLLDRARLRVKADRELSQRILRAQAFAHHHLGDGARARAAARAALTIARPAATDTTSAREDRKLLETLVGADWQASRTGTPPSSRRLTFRKCLTFSRPRSARPPGPAPTQARRPSSRPARMVIRNPSVVAECNP